jgi:hypothetical protein
MFTIVWINDPVRALEPASLRMMSGQRAGRRGVETREEIGRGHERRTA